MNIGPMEIPFDKSPELAARAAFKGLVEVWGPDLLNKAIQAAELQQELGHKGITLPSEDHSTMITIDEQGVSFSIEQWGPYLISMDTAKIAVMEVRAEREANNPKS